MIVNKNQLADVVGKSERTLTEWQDDGLPIESVGGRGMENQYDTAKVIEWIVQRSLSGKTVMPPKELKDFYEARLREMDVAERAGLLVSVEEVAPLWEGAVLAARTDLLGMGPRLKAAMDARYGINVDMEMIEAEIHHALTKLSEKPPSPNTDDDEPEGTDVEENPE